MLRIISVLVGTLCGLGPFAVYPLTASAAIPSSYLNLNLTQDRYLGEVQNSTQLPNYTYFSGDMNLETQSPGFNYKLNPVAEGTAESSSEFYFGIPEAYVQPRHLAPGFNLTVGRQKRTWSRLDEEFNLGIWQPQLRWDYLAPKQEGLIGVFFDWSLSDNVQFSFFTSPLFLPDQGPNYSLNNGQFNSANRWFTPPQSSVGLFSDTPAGRGAPLYFQLDKPSDEQVIMNSSFGFGIGYQSSSPFWWQMNYAYKPMNQIHLGVECSNCYTLPGGGPSGNEITAVIHPVIVKHNVFTMETGFDRIDDRGWLSLTGDFPNSSGMPSDWVESSLNDEVIAGAAYQHYIYSWIKIPSWLKYSYMRVFDVKSTQSKTGVGATEQLESSLDRYPYREIAAVEWRVLLRQKVHNRLEFKNRYSYSIPEKGGWLSSSFDWTLAEVTWTAGLDFLGSDTAPDSPNAGLYTRYRTNDRVFVGASYVF